MKEKNQNEAVFSLIILWMTYLVLTLLLIIVRKLFALGMTIFIVRAVFLLILVLIIPFCEKAFASFRLQVVFWVVLLYGGIITMYQSYLTTNNQIATISLLELMLILIVTCNLK
jgi:phospholipid-translocating ATPase